MSYGVFVTVPGIPGYTSVKEHKDKIEAHTFNYGVVHPHNGGLSSGERSHSDITISKFSDKASALLMLACIQGKQFDEVKFEFYKVDRGSAHQKFASYTIKHVIVSSFQLSGNGKGGSPELDEIVSFGYQEIAVEIHGSQASDEFRVNPGQHALRTS